MKMKFVHASGEENDFLYVATRFYDNADHLHFNITQPDGSVRELDLSDTATNNAQRAFAEYKANGLTDRECWLQVVKTHLRD